jgi:DNA-directed RNA polymerase subunit RPC12/RpoP
MPQPIERNEVFAGLKVVKRIGHAHYSAKCYRCKRSVTVAARSLRLKRNLDCPHCFPRKVPLPQVSYDRGLPSVAA